jgi:hypothetical protein
MLKREQDDHRYFRRKLDLPARVVILSYPDGLIQEEGHARVRNISPRGVLLSDLNLPSQSLPLLPFQLALFIEDGALERIHMMCSIKRLVSNGKPSLSLSIEQIPEKCKARLIKFLICNVSRSKGGDKGAEAESDQAGEKA